MINQRSIAVLLTCFNRKKQTLETLRALQAQSAEVARTIHVILVDDGSSDGTAEAVATEFPEVEVLKGTGSLYWNGGMRKAFAHAQRAGFEYYLLLNDDTVLAPHCLDTLLLTSEQLKAEGILSIVAASICDPHTGKRSYGGVRRTIHWNRVVNEYVEPHAKVAIACDTMNGNCVLVPADIAQRLGNLEAAFTQQFGDFDYGFRTRQAGFAVHIAPGYLGTCTNNPVAGTWRDSNAPFQRRWKHLLSPKGIPPVEWFIFSRRHYGHLWPLYYVAPFVRVLLSRLARV